MTFNTPNTDVYDFLMNRRSVKTRDMAGPGPDRATIDKILRAASRVPDHGKLAPWRFIVLEGDDRERLGALIADALIRENETSETIAEKMKGYATQTETLIVAVSSPNPDSAVPQWEQVLSAGAACQNLLIAAGALGYAAQWLTGWSSYSPLVTQGLGLSPIEKIAGYIFLGQQTRTPSERPRPVLDDIVTYGWPKSAEQK